MTTQQLIDQALALPEEERAIIVDSILRSLHTPNPSIDALWAEEAERRLNDIQSGAVKPLDGEEVLKDIREQFNL
ncbi:MAG: addiction module protein [Planctomycetota bacterium]|jgi:putative addiction module component (TIGR02574 family)